MDCRCRWNASWLIAVVGLSLAGCGGADAPPLGRVSGKITMAGEPLSGLIVLFKPQEGRAATATTDAQGRYDLEYTHGVRGAKVGPTTVMFEWPLGAKDTKALAAKYTTQSELKVDVKAGANTFDFNLDGDPSKKVNVAD
ncbi:MAG TPA: carboxypeptidase-like regulatory domain-containing protein [Planctomycetaceae bacterium]|nr:carboxypeptidase-like regulatory domain-containing protein [Planctomycetaceae bacterium]